jgi:hypothetical protein
MAEDDFFAQDEPEAEDEVEQPVVEPEPEDESAPEDAQVAVRLSESFSPGVQEDEEGSPVENERVVSATVGNFETVELSDTPVSVDPKHAAALVEARFAEVAE